MNYPILDFLHTNFPELITTWKLSEDEWNRMLSWYIGTGNTLQVIQGVELVSFILFRPMTKDQLTNRSSKFEWDVSGEYLYVPLFVTKKSWKGRGMWNMMKELAPYPYPNIKFIAYENFSREDGELNIVPAPSKHEGRRPHGKQAKRTSTSGS